MLIIRKTDERKKVHKLRTNQLMLYKNMEHGELLHDMTFLMENCENEYYNKEDMVGLLFECLNELLEMTASHGFVCI